MRISYLPLIVCILNCPFSYGGLPKSFGKRDVHSDNNKKVQAIPKGFEIGMKTIKALTIKENFKKFSSKIKYFSGAMAALPIVTVVFDLIDAFGESDGEKTRKAIGDLKQSMHNQFGLLSDQIEALQSSMFFDVPINNLYLQEKNRLERLDARISTEEERLKDCNAKGFEFLQSINSFLSETASFDKTKCKMPDGLRYSTKKLLLWYYGLFNQTMQTLSSEVSCLNIKKGKELKKARILNDETTLEHDRFKSELFTRILNDEAILEHHFNIMNPLLPIDTDFENNRQRVIKDSLALQRIYNQIDPVMKEAGLKDDLNRFTDMTKQAKEIFNTITSLYQEAKKTGFEKYIEKVVKESAGKKTDHQQRADLIRHKIDELWGPFPHFAGDSFVVLVYPPLGTFKNHYTWGNTSNSYFLFRHEGANHVVFKANSMHPDVSFYISRYFASDTLPGFDLLHDLGKPNSELPNISVVFKALNERRLQMESIANHVFGATTKEGPICISASKNAAYGMMATSKGEIYYA